MTVRRCPVAALMVVVFVAAACGGGDAASNQPDTPTGTTIPGTARPEDTVAGNPGEPDTAQPESASAEPQIVRFATADGETLEAALYGEGPIGIVLAHMRGRDKTTWDPFARAAADLGYQVLAFDFRGYGGSTGERDTALEVDLGAAIEFLRSQGITNTVVIGASMGGTAAVNAAAAFELSAVASLSAPGNFLGLAATDVAADIAEPILVIAAADDQPYATDAAAIAAAAPAAQLEILDGNAHGTNLFDDGTAELTSLLLDFVRARVG